MAADGTDRFGLLIPSPGHGLYLFPGMSPLGIRRAIKELFI
jgi:hypothetical protein